MHYNKINTLFIGWDRTPLFISLLRISLWADGVIHTSLNSYQLLYYTIAYDWMLFGHDLANRYTKGEDIFFFCFHFLKYICDDKFSIHTYDDKFNIQRHSKFRHSVLRTDSDAQLDNVMFDNEISPNSNISCNSSTGSSHVSRDNQDLQSTTFYSYPGEEDFQSGYTYLVYFIYLFKNSRIIFTKPSICNHFGEIFDISISLLLML